jgi:hypothetical protein
MAIMTIDATSYGHQKFLIDPKNYRIVDVSLHPHSTIPFVGHLLYT